MSRSSAVLAPLVVLLVPLTAVVAIVASGGIEEPLPGLPDPGDLTRWGRPVLRAVHDAAAALTVGLLVVVAAVLPAPPGSAAGDLGGPRGTAVRLAAASATVWALASVVGLVLAYADVIGTNPLDPGVGGQVLFFATSLDQGRALALSALMTVVVASGSWLATRLTTVGVLAALSLVALLPLTVAGHAASAANHDAAVDTLAAHLVGVSVWTGGLAALALLRRCLGAQFAPSLARYSGLAGWCYVLVAGSGVVGGLVRLGGVEGLATAYGALLVAKTLVLVVLGGLGWAQRRRVLMGLGGASSSGRLFARFAAVEVAVMAVAMGLAVALARTSPADASAPARQEGLAESLLGYPMPPPLTAARWVTEWRIDALWVPLAVLGAAAYLAGVARLRRRGDRWPLLRTAAWLGGCVVLVWATSSGPGVYGMVLFSMHMVQHMTIAMAVPILLVLGAPVTLALRSLQGRRDGSRGPREWLLLVVHSAFFRLTAHPVVAGGLFVGSLVAFYYTPLFELALSSHTGHALMTAHFLASGYLFAWMICGPDPGPGRPPYPFRLMLLIATFGFHAFIGVAMMSSVQILGGEWFAALPRDWGPTLAEDQELGGALAWALGDYPIGILIFAMISAWVASDEREARRYDRRADRDGDAALEAYNAHLRSLAGIRGSSVTEPGEDRRGQPASP